MPLIGPSPDVRGFWVAEAIWITHAGGAGKAVAEWMTSGAPEVDLHEADLNRFPAHALSSAYVEARGAQQYREVYDIIHPLQQMENPRDLRLSPFHPRQRELGAVFFENAGWEVPQWFEANARLPRDPSCPERSGWEARGWSPIEAAEHKAARERAVLYDLTPLAKIEIRGSEGRLFPAVPHRKPSWTGPPGTVDVHPDAGRRRRHPRRRGRRPPREGALPRLHRGGRRARLTSPGFTSTPPATAPCRSPR